MANSSFADRNHVRRRRRRLPLVNYLNIYSPSESAALENTATFFPLLTTLTDPTTLPSPPPTTPEAIHAFALPVVQAHLSPSPGALASFTASLALHVSTPKIEAFYQYYVENGLEARRRKSVEKDGECESWVDWYGEVVCDVESLARLEALASNNTTR
jgi:UDP-glucose:glycoprotein glucosyltransferase